ncbi:hypothetical protein [Pseudobacteroides cellulosolvens]|uniref:Uncharacterized protein n=1 Tax=Pseudobacteroides cellulosolvens ATCC 35603 = DSM 2933 TaxID=398512 RepID=A0A0L6JK04_9FIRM|nr:hypothetical protein [Pseudobacteroides cellulosolvens]KNY26090.1 hypothetical protein Bccel_1352 [Pseudobacteroides cellulosolvens ATCC 35603 = DSM 2933]
MFKEINIYITFDSWMKEEPDAVIKGAIKFKGESHLEIQDENGYTQIINLNKLYAVVY